MPKLAAFLLLIAGCIHAFSAELPKIEDCIPQSIANLKEPVPRPFPNGLSTAVTAATEKAQLHTLQGLNHLHGGWEFEAMRHFSVAMKEDPRCLLAHWGMVMTMLSPSIETDACRLATTQRLLELINEGEGTDLERGYAYGLLKYMEAGPASASDAFRKVSEKFPNEMQAQIFAALFGRSGYDDLGTIKPDQETAETRLLKLIEANPGNTVPLHALVLIRADAADLRPSLHLARQLCELTPDYPPYQHLLGHYEWRCGEHSKAASAFGRAATLFSLWMKNNDASPADCGEWVRAECYRIVALISKGDFDNAIASAEKIAATSVDPTRPAAPGTRKLLWDAKTLPARVLMARNLPGDSAKALASLQSPEDAAPFREKSLSYWWLDGLRIALNARDLIESGELAKAAENAAALSYHGEAMVKKRAAAFTIGEQSEWMYAFRSLEVLAAELRGRLALAGPEDGRGSAFNWFRAAADRQKPATMLNPPALLTPMAMRLGDYYLAAGKPRDAVNAYQEALEDFPNNQVTLDKLIEAKKLAEAAKVRNVEEKNED
ncbi:MAG: hypothetical protein ABJQ29_06470 [Luteolibacter sp.]